MSNKSIRRTLDEPERLTEEKIDDLADRFLKNFEEGKLEKEGWPIYLSAYTISKAFMNAYTRILAMKYPNVLVNCVCPGFVKTDITCDNGVFSTVEGALGPVRLALLSNDGPSGCFFSRFMKMEKF